MTFKDRFTPEQRRAAIANLEAAHQENRDNPSDFSPGIIGYWGWEGAGKSLMGASTCAQSYAHGIPVFHNDSLLFGETLDMDRLRVGEYQKCIIYYDEVQELLDAYLAQSNVQIDVIGSLIAIRHNDVQVVTTGQRWQEINPRATKRYKYMVDCEIPRGGDATEVRATWTYRPGTRLARRAAPVLYRRMHRYMPLYHSNRHWRIGHHRITAAQQRARQEFKLRDAVLQILQGAADQGVDEVTSTQIQEALREHFEILATVKKIGDRCRDLGLEQGKFSDKDRKGQRFWKVPDEMMQAAHDAAKKPRKGAA